MLHRQRRRLCRIGRAGCRNHNFHNRLHIHIDDSEEAPDKERNNQQQKPAVADRGPISGQVIESSQVERPPTWRYYSIL